MNAMDSLPSRRRRLAKPSVDLNADLGEGGRYDNQLLEQVSSCNIACGGHIGDARSMQDSIAAASANNVAIGAHPAYPDRAGFGRRSGFLAGAELRVAIISQLRALQSHAEKLGARLAHVKPHGALYNDAATNRALANDVAAATAEVLPGSGLFGLPDSEIQHAAARYSLCFIAEGFIDRTYRDDGQLVPRSEPGAVHEDLHAMLQQAKCLLGHVDTLCIHGDTSHAAEIAGAVRATLETQGVLIHAFGGR